MAWVLRLAWLRLAHDFCRILSGFSRHDEPLLCKVSVLAAEMRGTKNCPGWIPSREQHSGCLKDKGAAFRWLRYPTCSAHHFLSVCILAARHPEWRLPPPLGRGDGSKGAGAISRRAMISQAEFHSVFSDLVYPRAFVSGHE